MIILAVILLVKASIFLFYASYNISSGVYVKTLSRKKTDSKEIALTFDDGPNKEHTLKVLDVLKNHNIEAAFFCVGTEIEKNPDLLKKIKDEGHLIGNHTHSHKSQLPLWTAKKIEEDIRNGGEIIEKITGEPVRFFRPPFGVTNPQIKKALKSFNYYVIGWNIRSLDTSIKDTDKVVARIIRKLKPGSVILLHDRLPNSAEIVEKLLDYLQKNEYSIKRVDKLFGLT
jgi:peptidoglycan/xylan/chitin deacetylase (PgdA/CDA1 family)